MHAQDFDNEHGRHHGKTDANFTVSVTFSDFSPIECFFYSSLFWHQLSSFKVGPTLLRDIIYILYMLIKSRISFAKSPKTRKKRKNHYQSHVYLLLRMVFGH